MPYTDNIYVSSPNYKLHICRVIWDIFFTLPGSLLITKIYYYIISAEIKGYGYME